MPFSFRLRLFIFYAIFTCLLIYLFSFTNVLASWTYDGDIPEVGPLTLSDCYSEAEDAQTDVDGEKYFVYPITVTDSPYETKLKDVLWEILKFDNIGDATPNPNPIAGLKDVPATKKISESSVVGVSKYTSDWEIWVPIDKLNVNNEYLLLIKPVDNARNTPSNYYDVANLAGGTSRIKYKGTCDEAWFQTTVGDVHSNDIINSTGGPK